MSHDSTNANASGEADEESVEVQSERRSIFAQGRKDHIYRSTEPEPVRPRYAAPQGERPAAPKDNAPTRQQREQSAQESFGKVMDAESKRDAQKKGLILRLVVFLVIAFALSCGVAAAILKILNH